MTIPTGPSPVDRSTRSPGDIPAVKRLMVVPPSGTVRARFESVLNDVERAMMGSGITVISAAVTARVVADGAGGRGQAVDLSDVERALVLAKDAGADAVLQLGRYEFAGVSSRRFCGSKADVMGPCAAADWLRTRYHGEITGRRLYFSGRLIEVRTGQVLAAIDVEQGSADEFPWAVAHRPRAGGDDNLFAINCPELLTCNYPMCEACREAERRAAGAVLATVARTVAHRPVLGIQMRDLTPEELAQRKMGFGVFITRVDPNGPADRAGLKGGEVLVGFNEHEIRSGLRLLELLSAARPGEVVRLVVEGERGRREVAVTLQ